MPNRGVKKLTFLIHTMETLGGMERVTATVAGGLVQRGFAVEIVTLWGQTSAYPLPPEVQLNSMNLPAEHIALRSRTPLYIRSIRRHLRRSRPDVLITVDTFLSVFAFPAVLGLNVRRVAWEHFNFHFDFGMKSRRLGRWVSAFLAHDVVTLTEQDTGEWKRVFPRAPARIQTITNPLPFPPLTANPYSPESRTVLAVGWLDRRKGFDLLLEAWSKVERDFPEWSLKIIGSGGGEQKLRLQAEALGLKRWVLGEHTQRIEQEYQAAGVYCLSSRSEGLPMVLIESQAHGVPAVAFDCLTGPAELLEPGGGLLVEPGNVSEFAGALRVLLADPEARRQMSARGFQGSQRHDPEQVLERWTAFMGRS